MSKLKTTRAAAKRFKRTASGRIKRRKAYHTHILAKKDRKRKRNLRQGTFVHPSDGKRIERLLPND